jgi:hypothetical protein
LRVGAWHNAHRFNLTSHLQRLEKFLETAQK